jgi:hypothetical protein
MAYTKPKYNESVFVNCPFDEDYKQIFQSLIFCIYYCGFFPRSALEDNTATENRLEKIYKMIDESKYGIHDLSRVEVDIINNLPRFNMPFELGLFLGCNKYSESRKQKLKKCMIVDTTPHRFKMSLSDMAGIDGYGHSNNPSEVIKVVRHWLQVSSKKATIPSAIIIRDAYNSFFEELPNICTTLNWDINDLGYNEFVTTVEEWIDQNK